MINVKVMALCIESGDTYIGSWNNGLKHGAVTYHWAGGEAEVDVSWYQSWGGCPVECK